MSATVWGQVRPTTCTGHWKRWSMWFMGHKWKDTAPPCERHNQQAESNAGQGQGRVCAPGLGCRAGVGWAHSDLLLYKEWVALYMLLLIMIISDIGDSSRCTHTLPELPAVRLSMLTTCKVLEQKHLSPPPPHNFSSVPTP